MVSGAWTEEGGSDMKETEGENYFKHLVSGAWTEEERSNRKDHWTEEG